MQKTENQILTGNDFEAVKNQILMDRLREAVKENGRVPNFEKLDQDIFNLLAQLGISFEEVKSDFEKDLESFLGINKKEHRDLLELSLDFTHAVYGIFQDWVISNNGIVIKHKGSYEYENDKKKTQYKLFNGDMIPEDEHVLLLFNGVPHVIRFRHFKNEYRVEVTGRNSQFILNELKRLVDSYFIERCKGKLLDINLKEIELKTWEIGDLVFSPSLSSQVNNLLTSFKNWYLSDRVNKWGYILIGRPGVGKTTTGGLLVGAKPKDCTYIYAPASEIDTASQIERLFHLAKVLSPCVLQIDDVDLISQDRETQRGGLTSALMENLDGLQEDAKVFTVLTTNNPGNMEKAIINRAGRVSGKIIFDGFKECLGELILLYAQKYDIKILDKDIDKAVSIVNEEKRDLTPDEAKNVCIRMHLLFQDEKIEPEKLKGVIEEVYDAFHAAKFNDESYLNQ